MKRTAAALLILVVVALLAACGSGGGGSGSSNPNPNAALTPAAYRTQVNGLCTQAKQKLGSTSASSAASSQASATAALEKALGIFQPILTTLQQMKAPSSMSTAHSQLVASLKTLVDGGQALVSKLKAGTPLSTAFTGSTIKTLGKAVVGLKTGFATLGLTTCTRLIGGK